MKGYGMGAGGSYPAWTASRRRPHPMRGRRSTGRRRQWPCCHSARVRAALACMSITSEEDWLLVRLLLHGSEGDNVDV